MIVHGKIQFYLYQCIKSWVVNPIIKLKLLHCMSNKAISKEKNLFRSAIIYCQAVVWLKNDPNFKYCIFILPRKPQEFNLVIFFEGNENYIKMNYLHSNFHLLVCIFSLVFGSWCTNFYNPSSINKYLKEVYDVKEGVSKHEERFLLKWFLVCDVFMVCLFELWKLPMDSDGRLQR